MNNTQQPTQRINDFVVSDGGHAFDTRTGRSYSVNATGQIALTMLQDGKSRAAVIDSLIYLCGQPKAVVDAGFDAFMNEMARIAS